MWTEFVFRLNDVLCIDYGSTFTFTCINILHFMCKFCEMRFSITECLFSDKIK